MHRFFESRISNNIVFIGFWTVRDLINATKSDQILKKTKLKNFGLRPKLINSIRLISEPSYSRPYLTNNYVKFDLQALFKGLIPSVLNPCTDSVQNQYRWFSSTWLNIPLNERNAILKRTFSAFSRYKFFEKQFDRIFLESIKVEEHYLGNPFIMIT